jgi:hypothetical protein
MLWKKAVTCNCTSRLDLFFFSEKYGRQPAPQWAAGPRGVILNAVVSVVSISFRVPPLLVVARCIGQSCRCAIRHAASTSLHDNHCYDEVGGDTLRSKRHLGRLSSVCELCLILQLFLTKLGSPDTGRTVRKPK